MKKMCYTYGMSGCTAFLFQHIQPLFLAPYDQTSLANNKNGGFMFKRDER